MKRYPGYDTSIICIGDFILYVKEISVNGIGIKYVGWLTLCISSFVIK